MQLARAVTSGATLASLLQSVITAGCDCDGFLYGERHTGAGLNNHQILIAQLLFSGQNAVE